MSHVAVLLHQGVFDLFHAKPADHARDEEAFGLIVGASAKDLRWHDLRHTSATMAAETGASLRDLMHRHGHSTAAACLRYQHYVLSRD